MYQRIRIVLIEDQPADVYWFQHILGEMGQVHDVRVFPTGVAAVKGLRGQEKPDLIFTDWFLPVLNAPEFIADLKASPGLSEVPVYVFSGIHELQQQAITAGAQGCLSKPVAAGELQAIFDSVSLKAAGAIA